MSVTCLIGVVGGRAVITRISDVITITISLLSVWNQRTVIKDISKTCTDKRIKNFTTLHIHIPANALVYTYSEIQDVIILCTALRAGRSRKRERHQKWHKRVDVSKSVTGARIFSSPYRVVKTTQRNVCIHFSFWRPLQTSSVIWRRSYFTRISFANSPS